MRLLSGIFITLFFLVTVISPVRGAEVSAQDVFKDSFYGGLLGALVGGALLVFRDDRSEHYDMIGYGAAVGVIGGAVYGLTRAGRSLAEFGDGKVVFRFPALRIESGSPFSGYPDAVLKGDLLTLRF